MDLNQDTASEAWSIVTERVAAFVAAWDAGGEPPSIGDFLPANSPELRRLTLIELVKADLGFRWSRPVARLRLEDYLAAFPELADEGRLPCDLIYEEFYVRKQSGEQVAAAEYCERFAQQADELRRLLGPDEATCRSAMLVGPRPPARLAAGDSIDDFELLVHLGKGAFADVFLARQRSMQRLVALKASADQGNEPQTMAQLDHPHIVRVYDQRLLPERGLRLLYMQYVSGGTLQSVVAEARATSTPLRCGKTLFQAIDAALYSHGESPPADSPWRRRLADWSWPAVVCWLGARLASALDYAHGRGVLHRDLKPANVLIAADGSPKLADFNISFSSKIEGATPAAYFGGSVAYMSPEQLEAFNPSHPRSADEIDGRADIYSLGVVLWELLTGSRPFRDEQLGAAWSRTLAEMTSRRRSGLSDETAAMLPADLPPGMKELLLKCLAPRVEDRFSTAGELARQLELCLQPSVQRLLRPPPHDWSLAARRYCLPAFVLAGVLPNLGASVMNIVYNWFEIIRRIGPDAKAVFFDQVMIVNPIAYLAAIAVLLGLAAPIFRCVRARCAGIAVPPSDLQRARRRCLSFGDWVAWVSAAEWTISGVVFPVWLHLGDVSIDRGHYLHFLTSQVLCGLIAAGLSFFAVSFLSVRAFYPVLVDPQVHDPAAIGALRGLAQRTGVYFVLAIASYFLATFAVLWLADAGHDRAAIGALGAVGFPSFILAYWLSSAIRRDLETLSLVVQPGADGPGA
ncbi:MAG TPA: serine/threonine-protein kinase, partial [Pirellulales bacterium]|nr:serine/threonine-protein kinase [Pirellulales bacterium]